MHLSIDIFRDAEATVTVFLPGRRAEAIVRTGR